MFLSSVVLQNTAKGLLECLVIKDKLLYSYGRIYLSSFIMEALSFVSIIEKDKHDLITTPWVYPNFPDGYDEVLISRAQLQEATEESFLFSRFAGIWHYTYTFPVDQTKVDEDSPLLKYATLISITIGSKHFFPERYLQLAKLFAQMFLDAHGKPMDILNAVLSLASSGTITYKDEEVSLPSLDEEKKALLKTPLPDIVSHFGTQSVLLWHAMLTKRSLLVTGTDVNQLLDFIRGFPLFVFHRQDWTILRPLITAEDIEIQDLTAVSSQSSSDSRAADAESSTRAGVVCGTCDESVPAIFEWDFIADLETKKVNGREASDDRDDDSETSMGGAVFEMTPFHKQAASIMKKATSQKELLAGLTNLTQKLTERISSLKEELGDKPFTPNNLHDILPDAGLSVCRFLVDINRAENG